MLSLPLSPLGRRPEIAVSCVIEQGANGTDAGIAVRKVFDYYFGLGDYAPAAPSATE